MSIEGKSPPVPEKICPIALKNLYIAEKFDYDIVDDRFFPSKVTYMVHGKKGTKAGDGGDGGKQGSPALAGKILVFELDQAANVKTHAINGKCALIGLNLGKFSKIP